MDPDEAQARELAGRIKRDARYHAAPPELTARILASLPHESAPGISRAPSRWNAWWAGSALGTAAALVLTIGIYLAWPGADAQLADEVVAGHVRSLMVDHLSDIASSDRHSVKPWFAGKLDFSPPVPDLSAQGFVLIGGRLDYLDHRPVAALVYRHDKHLVNLFVWPSARDAPQRQFHQQGFNLVRWARAGMGYWAVSDLNSEELLRFTATLASASE